MVYNLSMKLKLRRHIFVLILLCAGGLYAQGPGGGMSPSGPPSPSGGQTPGQPPGPPPKPPEKKDPPKDESRIFYYRGNRTYAENLPLKINQIKCVRLDENIVGIEILFNQRINPRSIKNESIFIDNKLLPDFCRCLFNKRGDTIKLRVPVKSQTFKFRIMDVRSFEGNEIEPVELLVEVKDDK